MPSSLQSNWNASPGSNVNGTNALGALPCTLRQVFPLLCPMCGGQMRIIAFITEGAQIRRIPNHIGVDSEPPHISPARGPMDETWPHAVLSYETGSVMRFSTV